MSQLLTNFQSFDESWICCQLNSIYSKNIKDSNALVARTMLSLFTNYQIQTLDQHITMSKFRTCQTFTTTYFHPTEDSSQTSPRKYCNLGLWTSAIAYVDPISAKNTILNNKIKKQVGKHFSLPFLKFFCIFAQRYCSTGSTYHHLGIAS